MKKETKTNIKEKELLEDITKRLYLMMKDDLKKEEAERKRCEQREEFKRKKYLESLKPISVEEFKKELENIIQRYREFLEYSKKENILFCSMDLNFVDIINRAKLAKSELELAEILDKTEATMNDLENIRNIVNQFNGVTKNINKQKQQPLYIPFEEVKQKER